MIQFNKNAWEMQIQVTLCCKGMKPYMHPNRQLVMSYMIYLIGINDPIWNSQYAAAFRVRTVFHGWTVRQTWSHTEQHDGTMNWQGEKQLQNPSPPTTDMFQFAILKLHFGWHTWLVVNFIGCCWETSRLKKKCAICSWVISGKTHTGPYIHWVGLERGDFFIGACLYGCLQKLYPSQLRTCDHACNGCWPHKHLHRSKKKGLKENSWNKQTD